MERDRNYWLAFALLGLVMLMWAGNSIVGRAVRHDIPPFALAFGRWALALLILLPFAVRPVWRDRAALLRGWKPVLLLGLLGVASFNSFLYAGLRYTTATNALLLQAAIPALVVLFEALLFRVRPGTGQTIAVGCSVTGVLVIVFEGDPASVLRLRFGTGDVLILAAVVVWSLYTVLLRLRPAVSPVSFVAVTFAIGAVAVAPLALWEWRAGERIVWTATSLAAFAYVAVLAALAAYFIYNWAAATIGAARAGQAITLMPLFGALLSALLLGERLLAYHLAGMALILAGIVIGALARRERDTAGASPGAALEDGP
ncbi:DMT family transporter [Novosphingobium album (ex Liu et al. 2023)]|uniref:DMT family transporter n=1 Tax=Novosphingobium album (ex Liu et al. 2023) TaxID=3031130 RepID=A0ABT5WVK3_9SPHN|nr:DMT family transporter [Novosphingobium album (ex Liu et al. 2023)]MDE8653930.1 DMT family transporter [Novosphingobium album (ex Liu et al. 2023)]